MSSISQLTCARIPLEELVDRSPERSCGPESGAANTHIHLPPNFSAFKSLEEAVRLARAEQLGMLGVSNYYDFSIYPQFVETCLAYEIYPLLGTEIIVLLEEERKAGVLINDPGNPGKMYICGKGITRVDPPTPRARRLLDTIRRNDEVRIRLMTARLADIFGAAGLPVPGDDSLIVREIVRRYGVDAGTVTLQERHVAESFQEELFRRVPAAGRTATLARILGSAPQADPQNRFQVQNEIRTHLMKVGKPGFVEETFISLEEARQLILELGGIPCYPVLADGTNPICAYEDPPEKLVDALESQGVFCAELIPLRNDPAVLERYVRAFRQAGFAVTAGTEHNTPDRVPLAPACRNGVSIPETVEEIFWEGAYVVAAHQCLTLRGETGYVDSAGRLNPAFPNREERLRYFRDLGRSVVSRQLSAAAAERSASKELR